MSALNTTPYEQAKALSTLIDNQVSSIQLDGGNYTVEFTDGQVRTLALQYEPFIIVLAALAHDKLRGIRAGLDRLMHTVETTTPFPVFIQLIDPVTLSITVSSSLGDQEFTLTRSPQRISPPYLREEFGNISSERITNNSPGRALSPLPASAFRTRARSLLECLLDGNEEDLLSLPPMMVVMGITDYCNHKCPFCFRERDPLYERSDGSIFTNNNLTALFMNLAEGGVQSIRLCGEGEDTIHPQYTKLILMARVAGINLMQITNGTMLERLSPLMARCIDFLRVSINGWTEDQYQQKHGLTSAQTFGRVIDGLKKLARERKLVSGTRTPTTCVSTVLTYDDCLTYRPEDFSRLFDDTGVDLAILKMDSECSRTMVEGPLRLKIHQDKLPSETASNPVTSPADTRAIGRRDAFIRILLGCQTLRPLAFGSQENLLNSKLQIQRDWITELNLGCILRYIRAEVERMELYNCSPLHDFYGDLRKISIRDAWKSSARKEGIIKDLKRPSVICPTCGWGDLFNIMNFFITQEIQQQPRYERLTQMRNDHGRNAL